MKHKYSLRIIRLVAWSLCVLCISNDAAAWGNKAHRAITMTSLQLIRRPVDDAFIAGAVNYELDLLHGAEQGIEAIEETVTITTDTQGMDAVLSEIQLLRAARQRGTGSYFAYRMGVLSYLVSDVVLPYGLSFTPEDIEIHNQIAADIETHITEYSFDPNHTKNVMIEIPSRYFGNKRPFLQDDRTILRNDYTVGRGYEGLMSEAGPAYFQRTVEAVADAWYSVYRDPRVMDDSRIAPRSALTTYYIKEIAYQLEVKKNVISADRAYRDFVEVNGDTMANYIKVGDLYYAFGTNEAQERAVHEWKIAQRLPGPARRESAHRIATHFILVGENMLRKSKGPNAEDTDLEDARRAFEVAMKYDGTNEIAANRISETTIAITDRRELYDKQQRFLDNATVTLEQAERSQLEQAYGDALLSYIQALSLLEEVGPEFAELQERAKEMSSDLKKDIKNATSQILDSASDRIVQGDTAMGATNFDEAMKHFSSVESIVAVIPEKGGSIDSQRKLDLIETAAAKIEDVQVAMKSAGQAN